MKLYWQYIKTVFLEEGLHIARFNADVDTATKTRKRQSLDFRQGRENLGLLPEFWSTKSNPFQAKEKLNKKLEKYASSQNAEKNSQKLEYVIFFFPFLRNANLPKGEYNVNTEISTILARNYYLGEICFKNAVMFETFCTL